MQINVRSDGSELSQLLEAAERGEEVILTRGDVAIARIVAIEPAPRPFLYGILSGIPEGSVPDFEPMSDEELDQWEREKEERLARNAP